MDLEWIRVSTMLFDCLHVFGYVSNQIHPNRSTSPLVHCGPQVLNSPLSTHGVTGEATSMMKSSQIFSSLSDPVNCQLSCLDQSILKFDVSWTGGGGGGEGGGVLPVLKPSLKVSELQARRRNVGR
jgi:hypothetical protein